MKKYLGLTGSVGGFGYLSQKGKARLEDYNPSGRDK